MYSSKVSHQINWPLSIEKADWLIALMRADVEEASAILGYPSESICQNSNDLEEHGWTYNRSKNGNYKRTFSENGQAEKLLGIDVDGTSELIHSNVVRKKDYMKSGKTYQVSTGPLNCPAS